jgi:hypothetical protein
MLATLRFRSRAKSLLLSFERKVLVKFGKVGFEGLRREVKKERAFWGRGSKEALGDREANEVTRGRSTQAQEGGNLAAFNLALDQSSPKKA